MVIRLAHPPDPPSALLLHGLSSGRTGAGEAIEALVAPQAGLNDLALRREYEATVLSAHAYAFAREHYLVCPAGAVFGEGTGPLIVSGDRMSPESLAGSNVAVSSTTSTAYLALAIALPGVRTMMLPADKLLAAVQTGLVRCALLDHTQQILARTPGLHVILDLGAWWQRKHASLPMPLQLLAVRRDLPAEKVEAVSRAVADSAQYALEHRSEALTAALRYAPTDDLSLLNEVLSALIDEKCISMGARGRDALAALFDAAEQAGVLFGSLPVEYA